MKKKTIFAIGLILLGLVLVLVAAMAVRPSTMKPADTTTTDLNNIPVGSTVSVVAQITEIKGSTLVVEVLEGNGVDVFDKRTGKILEMEQSADTQIVMGKPEDIFAGAIAQFDGTKLDANKISIQQIVILTGYVKGP